MKKLYTINTINNFMELIYKPFAEPFLAANPNIEITNLMDDSLLADTRRYGTVTPAVARRIYNYALAAQDSGADGILTTCTSVNMATEMVRPFLDIPMINIEEPVAEMAAEHGGTIGILATLPTSPAAIARLIESNAARQSGKVTWVPRVVEGAFDILSSGDRAQHDRLVREALYDLSGQVDAVVFAQISMSLIAHDTLAVPVYKIGASGFARIQQLMQEGTHDVA